MASEEGVFVMSTFSEVNSLFEGKFSYTLSWNSEDFFESNVIVIMLAHKPGKEISRAIDSVLSQVGPIRPGLLLIDDSTTNACVGVDERISNHPSIAVASTPPLSVPQGRNIGHYIVKTRIQRAEWICRLDTDDVLASTNSLQRIYHQLQAADSTVQWALAGNRLVEEGSLLNRWRTASPKPNFPRAIFGYERVSRQFTQAWKVQRITGWLHIY
jgi:hypothetical protein